MSREEAGGDGFDIRLHGYWLTREGLVFQCPDGRRLPAAGVDAFDVIVASELIYKQSPETFCALVATMRALGGARAHVLVVYEFRGELFDDAHFFELMLAHYEVQTVQLNAFAPQPSSAQPGALGAARRGEDECDDDEFLFVYRRAAQTAAAAV